MNGIFPKNPIHGVLRSVRKNHFVSVDKMEL